MRLASFLLGGKFSHFQSCLSAGWLPCETKEALSYCRSNKANKMRTGEISVVLLIKRDYRSDLSLSACTVHSQTTLPKKVQRAVMQMISHVPAPVVVRTAS